MKKLLHKEWIVDCLVAAADVAAAFKLCFLKIKETKKKMEEKKKIFFPLHFPFFFFLIAFAFVLSKKKYYKVVSIK